MIRIILAVTIAGALIATVAHAQTTETEDNRYQFNRVEDGYLRLDLRTGQVSLCSRRPVGWACATIADDRAAFDGEIARLQGENARLQGENAALKKAMLDSGPPLAGGNNTDAPVARGSTDLNQNLNKDLNKDLKKDLKKDPDKDLKVPNNADIDRDIDRMVAAVEKVWRRLVEMLISLQKDIMKKS